jgi:tRNA (guanine37-N1)-methyltransferase
MLTLQWACWPPPLRESLAEMEASIETGTTFVLRSAGRLVGSVRCTFDAEDGAWEIARLMVAPDLWGRGLGRALLEHAEGAAPGEASTYRLVVGADNDRAVRMYRRAGYSPPPGGPRGAAPGVLVLSRPRHRTARRD